MPGGPMTETMAQVAAILLTQGSAGPSARHAWLRGVDNAKFRARVVPGDRLTVEVTAGTRRCALARVRAVATIDGAVAAEADLLMGLELATGSAGGQPEAGSAADIHPSAIVHPKAK